jgi:exopolysaccharide biosynthesis polyprenyl glycosylphosphotransferase
VPALLINRSVHSRCRMPDLAVQDRWPESRDGQISDEVRRTALASRVPGVTLPRLLVASDTLALVLAALVAYITTSSVPLEAALEPAGLALLTASLPAWLVGAHLSGLYGREGGPALSAMAHERVSLGHLILIGTAVCLLVALATQSDDRSRDGLLIFAMGAVVLLTVARVAARAFARRHAGYAQTALIVGAGDVGQLVARKLLRHPEYGIDLVGFVDAPPKRWRTDVGDVQVLGAIDELPAIVRELAVDRVIVAFSTHNDQDTLALVRPLAQLNVHVDVVTRMFEIVGPRAGLLDVEGIPLVSISPRTRSVAASRLKRAIDIAGASVGLILAAPVFLWAAWRIPRESPGPVLYRQTRLGAGMQEFTMLKFRTMTVGADQSSHQAYIAQAMNGDHAPGVGELYKLDRGDAVTPSGRWLRKTSLDELPQLINVLQGTMSLVGPRPCLSYETEYFAPHHFERFVTPPGITGLWQVTARAHAGFPEALEMDVAYVRNWSIGLDLSLLLRTPAEVLRQRRATV